MQSLNVCANVLDVGNGLENVLVFHRFSVKWFR